MTQEHREWQNAPTCFPFVRVPSAPCGCCCRHISLPSILPQLRYVSRSQSGSSDVNVLWTWNSGLAGAFAGFFGNNIRVWGLSVPTSSKGALKPPQTLPVTNPEVSLRLLLHRQRLSTAKLSPNFKRPKYRISDQTHRSLKITLHTNLRLDFRISRSSFSGFVVSPTSAYTGAKQCVPLLASGASSGVPRGVFFFFKKTLFNSMPDFRFTHLWIILSFCSIFFYLNLTSPFGNPSGRIIERSLFLCNKG